MPIYLIRADTGGYVGRRLGSKEKNPELSDFESYSLVQNNCLHDGDEAMLAALVGFQKDPSRKVTVWLIGPLAEKAMFKEIPEQEVRRMRKAYLIKTHGLSEADQDILKGHETGS